MDTISPPPRVTLAATALHVLARGLLLILLALALNAVQAFALIPLATHLPQLGDDKGNMAFALSALTHVSVLWLVTPTQVEVRQWQRLLLAGMGFFGFFGVAAYALLVPLLRARQQRAVIHVTEHAKAAIGGHVKGGH